MEHAITLTPTEALTGSFAQGPSVPVDRNGATTSAARHSEQQRQGFRVGNVDLMLRYADSSELTEVPAFYRVPNAPDWFCGIANLHGRLVPVFDVALYIGLTPAACERRLLLVLAHGPDAAGILIDGMPDRLRWSEADLADTAIAPTGLAACITGAVLIEGRLRFDLDHESLLRSFEESLEQAH